MKQRQEPGAVPKYVRERLRREKAAARQAKRQAQSKLRKQEMLMTRPEPKGAI
jgi:hypothetical protein